MLCPCTNCPNQKKFAQREIIFRHLVTRGFTKNYTCWNKQDEEGLNELEATFLNEREVRHHATAMMKTLMTMDFLRKKRIIIPTKCVEA
jgi:hypothetical protein